MAPDTFTKIKQKLKNLGFGSVATDVDLINYYADLIFDEITLNINWTYIPDKLETLYIDMICGEFLYHKYVSGDLNEILGPEFFEPSANNVKVGDVSVGLSSGTSKQTDFENLLDSLRNPKNKRYLMDIVRKALT